MVAQRGFSLIELMVALVIAGIIVSIALPNYRQYVMRANRGDATAALLRLSAAQERFYMQNNVYADSLDDLRIDGTERGYYRLEIVEADADGYTARAAVIADGPQRSDDCDDFGTDETGQRLASHSEIADPVEAAEACWR